jgi:hypothetical protein
MEPVKNKIPGCWTIGLGSCLGLTVITPFVLAFLIWGFYLEEDWRGASAWKKAKAEIEADGGTVDPSRFVPHAPPESENFGALPIFEIEVDPKNPDSKIAAAMNAALEPFSSRLVTSKNDEAPGKLPYLGIWKQEKVPPLDSIRSRLADTCRQLNPSFNLSEKLDSTDLFAQICPSLAELRAANLTCPQCVFPLDYHAQPPDSMSFVSVTSPIRLEKALIYEERLAIYERKPELALADISVTAKLITGLQK